mmetsp:Transcript_56010/g.157882  ORF Transcript_56010/g.157882 Transcript_56010/m.157882 type:complete len:362 (+) Transcript_56010:163-1248(+)
MARVPSRWPPPHPLSGPLEDQHLGPRLRAVLHLPVLVHLPPRRLRHRRPLLAHVRVLLDLAVELPLVFLHDVGSCLELGLALAARVYDAVSGCPLLEQALLLVGQVLCFDIAVEGHHWLLTPRLVFFATSFCFGSALIAEVNDPSAVGVALERAERLRGAALHLPDLGDALLRRLGPLLVDVRLGQLALDLLAALVAPLPLQDLAVLRDHDGEVLLFLRVPSDHARRVLHLGGVVRHQVQLVLLHVQAPLLRVDRRVDLGAQVELLHGFRLLGRGNRRPRLRLSLPAEGHAVDLHVEPGEVGRRRLGRPRSGASADDRLLLLHLPRLLRQPGLVDRGGVAWSLALPGGHSQVAVVVLLVRV